MPDFVPEIVLVHVFTLVVLLKIAAMQYTFPEFLTVSWLLLLLDYEITVNSANIDA